MKIVEILVAMFVLTMITITGAFTQRTSMMIAQDAKARDAAYTVAEKKFTDLSMEVFPESKGTDTSVVNKLSFIRTWSITDTSNMRQATVTVSWKSLGGLRTAHYTKGI
jgi:hypothetical protein